MFRKEIKPLSESMIDAIGNTINKLEYVEEKVNVKGIQKAIDDGKSMDVIMTMFANKRTTNTDEIRKVAKEYMWKKRKMKEEVEGLEEADANSIGQALMKKHGEGSKVVKKSGRYYIKYTKNNNEVIIGPFNDLDDVMKHLSEEVELDESYTEISILKKRIARDTKKMKSLPDFHPQKKKIAILVAKDKKKLDNLFKKQFKNEEFELKEKMDPVGKADADIDNDGDVDSSDKYLHARRKAISKAMKKRKMNEQDTKMGTITVNSDEERKKRAAAYRAKKMKSEEVELDEANKKLPRKDVMQAAKIFAGAKKKGSLNSEAEDMVVDFAIKKLKYSKQDAEMLAQKAEVKYIDMVGEEVELEEGARFKMGDIVADKKGNAYSQDFVVTKVIPSINKSKPASYKVATKDGAESPNIWPESRLKLVKAVKEELELDESDKTSLKKHIEKLKKMYKDEEKKNKARNNPYSSPEMSQIAQAIDVYEKRLKEEVELDESFASRMDKASKKAHADAAEKRKKMGPVTSKTLKDINDKLGNTKKVKDQFAKEEVELDEAKSATGYTIYHKTFSSAVQHAISQVEKQGYTVDEDEWDRKVAMGPKKPSAGKTNSYTIPLLKNGKPTPRKLQMQVYYDEGRYELNMYIS